MNTPHSPLGRMATVVGKRQASDRTLILTLFPSSGDAMAWQPGQFIGLVAPDGRARYFSVANAGPSDACIELHINRVPAGTFTPALFDHIGLGHSLPMTGPYGDFALPLESPQDLILVAGGTGFAPIKACLQALARQQPGCSRPVHLYWGVRTEADLYDLDGVRQLQAQLPGLRYVPVLDRWAPGAPGRAGPVAQAVIDDFADLSAHHLCVCGVSAMVEAVSRTCAQARGFDRQRLVADIFLAGDPLQASAAPGQTVSLRVAHPNGDRALDVPVGQPLLPALRQAGWAVSSVCGGQGACGTCRVQWAPEAAALWPPPSRREARLLQFMNAAEGERLACQIRPEARHQGLRFSIPVDNPGARQ